MKTISEILCQQHVKGGKENEYQTVLVEHYPSGYKRKVAIAKRLSKHLGEDKVDGFWYCETDKLDKGLAAVCIIIYEHEKGGVLRSITKEYFRNGELAETNKQTF
jgi:hypothetical protein